MFEEFAKYEQEENSADINIAPLIDMVFILLIFFIITTTFNRQTGIDVTKPRAQSSEIIGRKVVMVGITRDGAIHVFGRQVSLDRLAAVVKKEKEKRPGVSVVIVADRKAEIGKAVSVMDRCILAGIEDVSIASEKER